jgi:hypothetical protein
LIQNNQNQTHQKYSKAALDLLRNEKSTFIPSFYGIIGIERQVNIRAIKY